MRKNNKELIARFINSNDCLPDTIPITIFMAGSPGAGKTEFSKQLTELFVSKPVRIDADEIREWIPKDEKLDATVYQKACTDGVNNLYSHVLKHNLNVIIDGTFAYANAITNVSRSIDKGRYVGIYYLYQDPILSWEFTKAREKKEHRNVPKDVFIKAFFTSIVNVNNVKATYDNRVTLTVVEKNFDQGLEKTYLDVESIDSHVPIRYTAGDLNNILT